MLGTEFTRTKDLLALQCTSKKFDGPSQVRKSNVYNLRMSFGVWGNVVSSDDQAGERTPSKHVRSPETRREKRLCQMRTGYDKTIFCIDLNTPKNCVLIT